MKAGKSMGMTLLMAWVLLTFAGGAWAGATLERLIDKSNWQEIEGLIPASAMERVKNGDYTLQIATLNFEPGEYQPPWVLESYAQNVGKFIVNENSEIADTGTGQLAKVVIGLPYPPDGIKKEDPKAVEKILHNGFTMRDAYGSMTTQGQRLALFTHDKYERHIEIQYWALPFYGHPKTAVLDNPNDFQNISLIVVTEPYDMAGTAMMTWRYKTSKPDTLFGYIPAIRRVRRMTPAGRSDSLFGSDFARDDGNWTGFDGKIPEFEWKLLGEKEMLSEFLSTEVSVAEKNEQGAWKAKDNGPDYPVFGNERPDWGGAAWWNLKSVWKKRPVWIVEGHSKNPYYNYGKTVTYVDKDTFVGVWKEIYDRSGQLWKTINMSQFVLESPDKSYRACLIGYWRIVDEINNRATMVLQHNQGKFVWLQDDPRVKAEDFTLGGFQRRCK
jgi:hypothetical protein